MAPKPKEPNATCQRCGTRFRATPSRLAAGKGKYCKKKCVAQVRSVGPCAYCGTDVMRAHKLDPRTKNVYCNRAHHAAAMRKDDKRITCYFHKGSGLWLVRRMVNGKWRSVSGATREQAWGRATLLDSGVPLNRGASRAISPEQIRYALEFLEPLDHIDRYDRQTQGVAMLWEYIRYAEAGRAPAGEPPEPVQSPPQRRRAAWLDALPKRVEMPRLLGLARSPALQDTERHGARPPDTLTVSLPDGE